MVALRMRDFVPNKERSFHALEVFLYEHDNFSDYVRQGRIRLKGSHKDRHGNKLAISGSDFGQIFPL